MQSAIRQVRRWRSQYHVTTESVMLFRNQETRILLDGKVLLKKTETRKAVKRAFETTKGSGYKLVKREVSHRCVGVSTMKANYELKRLKICQKIRPVFDNKAPYTLKIVSWDNHVFSWDTNSKVTTSDLSRYTKLHQCLNQTNKPWKNMAVQSTTS